MSDQRVAIISGGTRGIGAAIAHRMSKRGMKIALLSRRGDPTALPNAISLKCDIRNPDDVKRAVDTTVLEFGRIDIVVPNAGVGSYGSVVDVSFERVREMLDINLLGTINLVKETYPHLCRSEHADIVAVVSEAGRRGFPDQTAYCASKFGQLGFIRSLDHEARQDGIRVTSICPGGVATEFAMGDGRGRTSNMEGLNEMLSADDVAYLVETAIFTPRNARVLEAVIRSSTEASWG